MNENFNPPGWVRPKGYTNIVSAIGRQVFVAGQIGWNEEEKFESDDFADQAKQALLNIKTCLATAGAGPEHIVRLTWYVTDKQEYLAALERIGISYREVLGRCYPTMSLVQVAGLLEPRAKVEIEATAVVPVDN